MIQRDEYDANGLRWAKCQRCGMGWIENRESVELFPDEWTTVGERAHECPEPYPRELAESLHAFYVSTQIPTSQRVKARIELGLRT